MEMVKIDQVELLDALYGDGAWEISKAMSDQTKRKVTAGLSAVGATAGAAGLGYAALKTGQAYRGAKGATRVKRLGAAVKHEKLGTALIPLEVAGLGGEIMATKILHGDTQKKPKRVAKAATDARQVKYKLAKVGVDATAKGAKKAPVVGKKAFAVAQQAPEYTQRAVETTKRTYGSVKKNVDFKITGEVSKMNDEKKQVFGWASVIEVNGEPVIDMQGDVMTIDTIEKAAYTYVHGSRKGGNQHQRNGEEPLHVSDMIESFVLTPEKKSAMGLPDDVPTGWWVGFQINDDDTWDAYKNGKLKEFSIHGSGTRKSLEL
jgi:hypothetical protein